MRSIGANISGGLHEETIDEDDGLALPRHALDRRGPSGFVVGTRGAGARGPADESVGRRDGGVLPVTAPPESVFARFRERDRDVARRFYKKYLEIDGVPVLASADVADEALRRTHEIVTHLLAGRPDILGGHGEVRARA